MPEAAGALPGELPYGRQKQVEFARALMQKAKLVLLDEPMAGMSGAEKSAMTELIQRVRQQYAMSFLIVEHDIPVIMDISDKIVVLDFGRKIAEGTPHEVQAQRGGDRRLPGNETRSGRGCRARLTRFAQRLENVRKLRRGHHRRRLRRPAHAPPRARHGPFGARVRGRRPTWAACGTGTATRARAATWRACSTPIPSPTSWSRNGSGRKSTPARRRSCGTSSTSRTASTCAATSSSTRASSPRPSMKRPDAGRFEPRRARRMPPSTRHPAAGGMGPR